MESTGSSTPHLKNCHNSATSNMNDIVLHACCLQVYWRFHQFNLFLHFQSVQNHQKQADCTKSGLAQVEEPNVPKVACLRLSNPIKTFVLEIIALMSKQLKPAHYTDIELLEGSPTQPDCVTPGLCSKNDLNVQE